MVYFRRHNYDKWHRCPGWADAGFSPNHHTTRPDDWDDEVSGPFEDHWMRRRHWWQRTYRCNSEKRGRSGTLWTASLTNPWNSFLSHQCTNCDVRTLPFITRWLDPTWWKWVFISDVGWKIRDLRDHKRRWMNEDDAPWWSLLDAIWKEIRWWFWNRVFSVKHWLEDFRTWANREKREVERREIMEYYGIVK